MLGVAVMLVAVIMIVHVMREVAASTTRDRNPVGMERGSRTAQSAAWNTNGNQHLIDEQNRWFAEEVQRQMQQQFEEQSRQAAEDFQCRQRQFDDETRRAAEQAAEQARMDSTPWDFGGSGTSMQNDFNSFGLF